MMVMVQKVADERVCATFGLSFCWPLHRCVMVGAFRSPWPRMPPCGLAIDSQNSHLAATARGTAIIAAVASPATSHDPATV